MHETPTHFADRLTAAINKKGTPLIVGIDPRLANLPSTLRDALNPHDYAGIAQAFAVFGKQIIDVISSKVAAIKPQAAFFEQLGPAGTTALAEVVDYANRHELMVIMDGKRNDIGSTATAYAKGYLGRKPQSAWGCDALTINPYMGDDSLQPFIDQCLKTGSGLFTLVKTSNPGSNTFQELMAGDLKIYQHVAAWVQNSAHDTQGESGYGVMGAVVGATHPDHLAELRRTMPNTFFLIPGFGAQGGKAKDIAAAFDNAGGGAVVNSSRGIIFAYEKPEFTSASHWQQAVEMATDQSIQVINEALSQETSKP